MATESTPISQRHSEASNVPEATATGLHDRYGSFRHLTSRTKKTRRWLLGVMAVALGGLAAYFSYQNLGAASIEAQRLSFTEKPGNSMEIALEVQRDDPQQLGVCIVRVRDITGAESGRKEVLVPPGESSIVLSTLIKSIDRPVTADIFGCSYNIPSYLSTPMRPTG